MIPKIIHYCWFGKSSMPESAKKCIDSWKKYCPDYKIIQWNEENYDIKKNKYMRDAYSEKKWAFVSDYARIDVIHQYGGIYMDTDVELVKSLDSVLNTEMYAGWENRENMDGCNIAYENAVNFGLGYGAVKGHPVLKDLLELYEKLNFYNEDGTINLVACPVYQTRILKNYGLQDKDRSMQVFNNIIIYPETYFSPKSQLTGVVNRTENTISIHHFSMTWQNENEVNFTKLEWKLNKVFGSRWSHTIVRWISFPYRARRKVGKLRGKKENE